MKVSGDKWAVSAEEVTAHLSAHGVSAPENIQDERDPLNGAQ